MGDFSSFHMKKSQTSNNFNLEHNERIKKPSYLLEQGYFQINKSYAEALALKQSMVNRAIERYTQRTGQKFQSKSYEWSAVVNLKPSSTMQDLEKLAQHFQEKYGFQCYQIAIHKDEGHLDENGEKSLNLHAHLEFITLDKETGKNNFRGANTTAKALSKMQDEVAEILQMERGVRTLDLRADEKRARKRIEPRAWAKMKESEKLERKAMLENVNFKHKQELNELKFQANKEFLEFKSKKDDEISGLKADLEKAKKELFEIRRKEMIAEGDNTKEDYAEFRKVKKELCDDENATLEQTLKAIKDLKEKQRKDKEKLKELEKENTDLKAKEASKTAENQKNDENLYSTENVREIIAFKSEIETQANKLDKDIKEFNQKENVYLLDAKKRKIKEIDINANSLSAKISNNQHLQNFFSFEKCIETLNLAIKWLKDKGLNLQNTK